MFSETGDPSVTNATLSYITCLCSVDDTLKCQKTIYVLVMTLWLALCREKKLQREILGKERPNISILFLFNTHWNDALTCQTFWHHVRFPANGC